MASVTWTGLDDLRAALRALPAHLADEAGGIVQAAATDAMNTIIADYPEVSGNLKQGVKQKPLGIGPYGVAIQVSSNSPHAWMYENGTQARHTRTGISRGVMPPHHVVIPPAMRRRVQMYRDLKAMLEREGLMVSGDAV